MKILWFCLTPCSAVELEGKSTIEGGWLISLEKELRNVDGISLSIAYFSQSKKTPFEYCGVHYYPVYKSKIEALSIRMFPRVTHKYDNEFVEIINEVKPDLIHIHGSELEFTNVISLTKIPTVLSMQSILSPYENKYFSGITKFDSLRYGNILDKILFRSGKDIYKVTKKFAYNERKEFRNLKYIIGRTEWDRRISRLMAPQSKYYVVNEILRNQFYHNIWKPTQNKNIVLVTTMSNSLYKGLETVYKTASLLTAYNIKFSWKIIGQQYNNSYEHLVRRLTKIDPNKVNIDFKGRLNADEMINELLSSDIFIQVSHIENSPNSLCEAMLLGMPIISSFVGGTSTLLKDGIEGFLYQDGDIYSLAGCILLASSSNLKQITEHARSVALKRHDKQNIIKELLSCYNSILKIEKA